MLKSRSADERLMDLPILYSFRRCPYAMRARMALSGSRTRVALREIVLRDKPRAMLAASPKGTVPVLVLPDGSVLEQSLDIALWALSRNDPQGWLPAQENGSADMLDFIAWMDGTFKGHLDRAKYAIRYVKDGEDPAAFSAHHKNEGLVVLQALEERLAITSHLFGNAPRLADVATFPFVRQFANIDPDWWQAKAPAHLQAWLTGWVESPVFRSVMDKYPPWLESGEAVTFPPVQLVAGSITP